MVPLRYDPYASAHVEDRGPGGLIRLKIDVNARLGVEFFTDVAGAKSFGACSATRVFSQVSIRNSDRLVSALVRSYVVSSQ